MIIGLLSVVATSVNAAGFNAPRPGSGYNYQSINQYTFLSKSQGKAPSHSGFINSTKKFY